MIRITLARVAGPLAVLAIGTASLAEAQVQPLPGEPIGTDEECYEEHFRGHSANILPGPAAILRNRDQLGLTPAQVEQLETIEGRQRRALEGLRPQARSAGERLRGAVSGEIDIDAARRAQGEMAQIHSEMMVVNLQAMKDARAVLGAEQRGRWEGLMESRWPGAGFYPSMNPIDEVGNNPNHCRRHRHRRHHPHRRGHRHRCR